MRRSNGFTLLEVVIAGGLLTVGLLALMMLQARSLQAQRRVAVTRELVAAVETELWSRLAAQQPQAGECRSSLPVQVSECIVQVENCSTSETLNCSLTDSARASLVSVRAQAGSGQAFGLTVIHAPFPGP